MTYHAILNFIFFTTLLSCSISANKSVSSANLVTSDTSNTDNVKFKETWKAFADAVARNDLKQFKSLSTDCIYCTFCVDDTEEEDSMFTDFQNKNEKIWYHKLYNELSFIPINKFLEEDYKLIFDDNIIKRITDKSKIIFLNRGNDTLTNIYHCYKGKFRNNFPNIQEVLVTRIDPSPKYEGAQIALDFILTKEGYRFYSFSTIP